MELKDALKETIRRNGKGVLADEGLLTSFLSDLAPECSKEIAGIRHASSQHYFDGIARCDESSLPGAMEEFRRSASGFFAESVVENMAEMLRYALDIQTEKETVVPQSSEFSIQNGVLTGYGGASLSVRIPSEVASISPGAFRDCPEIQEVIIPEGITEIKSDTFTGCRKLRRVVLPSTLRTVEANAFKGCRNLTDIVLPVSLRTIGKDAFREAGNINYPKLFALCAPADIAMNIADHDLAEEYEKLRPKKTLPETKESNKTGMIIGAAAVIVAAVGISILSQPKPEPSGNTRPVSTDTYEKGESTGNESSDEEIDEVLEIIDQAESMARKGQYEEALELIRTYIDMFPDSEKLKEKEREYAAILDEQSQQIEFADETLNKVVHQGLGLSINERITPEQAQSITELEYNGENGNQIYSLEGIEYLTNLTSLHVMNNDISDLSPLRNLANLEKLGLANNRIKDVSALSGLRNLKNLGLDRNNISDISGLSGCTNLEVLYLNDNQIQDISSLSGMYSMKKLYLENNNITNIGALTDMLDLTDLYLSNNDISDLTALYYHSSLENLGLGNNRIKDIYALSGLGNLQNLGLDSNRITDISPLVNLNNLQKLYIGDNNVPHEDIEWLKDRLSSCDIDY